MYDRKWLLIIVAYADLNQERNHGAASLMQRGYILPNVSDAALKPLERELREQY